MRQTKTFKHKLDGCLVAQLTDRHLVGEQASLPDRLVQRPPSSQSTRTRYSQRSGSSLSRIRLASENGASRMGLRSPSTSTWNSVTG
jgi:hypothetical protein